MTTISRSFVDINDVAFFVVTSAGDGLAGYRLDVVEIEAQVDRENADRIIGQPVILFHDVEGAEPAGLFDLIHLLHLLNHRSSH